MELEENKQEPKEKKKYWLKLEKDFLNSSQIKVIKNMKNGKDYIIFYLALMLESVNSEGHLRFSDLVPYNEEMLASITDTNIDIVRSAMHIFANLGMIQILENGTLYLPDVPKRVGKEGESAERVRLYRERHNMKPLPYKEPKSNAIRQRQFKAKEICKQVQHIPYIEDYLNNKRYNGNYYLVLKRDKMKCSICSSIKNLCVHHIDGYDELKPENNEENKMVTLCRSCHINIHNGNPVPEEILQSIDYYNNESNKSCNSNVTKSNDNK